MPYHMFLCAIRLKLKPVYFNNVPCARFYSKHAAKLLRNCVFSSLNICGVINVNIEVGTENRVISVC